MTGPLGDDLKTRHCLVEVSSQVVSAALEFDYAANVVSLEVAHYNWLVVHQMSSVLS